MKEEEAKKVAELKEQYIKEYQDAKDKAIEEKLKVIAKQQAYQKVWGAEAYKKNYINNLKALKGYFDKAYSWLVKADGAAAKFLDGNKKVEVKK